MHKITHIQLDQKKKQENQINTNRVKTEITRVQSGYINKLHTTPSTSIVQASCSICLDVVYLPVSQM